MPDQKVMQSLHYHLNKMIILNTLELLFCTCIICFPLLLFFILYLQYIHPFTAKQCIEKCLLLLRFLPTTSRLPLENCISTDDNGVSYTRRKSSIVEADFQASSASPVNASPEAAHPISMAKCQVPDPDPQKKMESELFKYETPLGPQTKTAEKNEEPSSPPPTPTRKAPFSRARLRLLSFRSMEEAKMLPTVKEKYPILKSILDFVKDPAISHER